MIPENILAVRRRAALACSRVRIGHHQVVTIVAVSKNRASAEIEEAVRAGITDIGENRVQEAVLKYQPYPAVKWHMLGHLQTNKVKEAIRIFGLIHSVDSVSLAREIDKQATRIGKVQDILIEIKISPEPSKLGLAPGNSIGALREMAVLKNINIRGLMTIAPIVDESERARPYFRQLRELRDRIDSLNILSNKLDILSMGMSDDFETAIEEGSNMIRIGRAIFGADR